MSRFLQENVWDPRSQDLALFRTLLNTNQLVHQLCHKNLFQDVFSQWSHKLETSFMYRYVTSVAALHHIHIHCLQGVLQITVIVSGNEDFVIHPHLPPKYLWFNPWWVGNGSKAKQGMLYHFLNSILYSCIIKLIHNNW